MTLTWTLLAAGSPIIAAVGRDLVLLCRNTVRRASIERVVRHRTGAFRIVDRTAEGDIFVIESLPAGTEASELDRRSAQA